MTVTTSQLRTVHQGARGVKCPFEAALDAKMVQLRTQLDPDSKGATVPVVIHCHRPASDPEVKVINIIDGALEAAVAGETAKTVEAKTAEALTKTAVLLPVDPPATPEKKIPAKPAEAPTKTAIVPPVAPPATPEKTIPAPRIAPPESPPPSNTPKPQISESPLPPSMLASVGAAAKEKMESLATTSSPVLLAGAVGVCCLFIGTFFRNRSSSSRA